MTSCVSEFTTLGFYCLQDIPRNRCWRLVINGEQEIVLTDFVANTAVKIPISFADMSISQHFIQNEERTLKNLLRFQTKRSYIMKQHLTHSCMNHRWTAANLSFETNMPHSFWPLLFSLLPRSFFFQVQLPHRGITEDSRHSGGIGSALWWDPMAPFPLVSGSFIHWSIWSNKSIQMLNQFESSPYI